MVWGGENQKIFKDRHEAGMLLADKLKKYKDKSPVIFALPRGGVAVGFEVSRALEAPLDTAVSRKLGAPHDKEFGFGAIAPGDVVVLNNKVIRSLDLTQSQIDEIISMERVEMDRRMTRYKTGEYVKDLSYSTIIVVDDGLATGVTARAAIKSVKNTFKPVFLVFAVPVCFKDSVKEIKEEVDDFICLSQPDDFLAIGQWYRSFGQINDDKVLYYLSQAKKFPKR